MRLIIRPHVGNELLSFQMQHKKETRYGNLM